MSGRKRGCFDIGSEGLDFLTTVTRRFLLVVDGAAIVRRSSRRKPVTRLNQTRAVQANGKAFQLVMRRIRATVLHDKIKAFKESVDIEDTACPILFSGSCGKDCRDQMTSQMSITTDRSQISSCTLGSQRKGSRTVSNRTTTCAQIFTKSMHPRKVHSLLPDLSLLRYGSFEQVKRMGRFKERKRCTGEI